MMRMPERIRAHLRNPAQREGVPAEKIVEILERRFYVPGVGLDCIGYEELNSIVRHNAVRPPDVISGGHAHAVAVAFGSFDDLIRCLKGLLAKGRNRNRIATAA